MKKIISILSISLVICFILSGCQVYRENENSNPEQEGEMQSYENSIETLLFDATEFSEGKALVLYENSSKASYYNLGVLSTDGKVKEIKDIFVSLDEMKYDENNDSNESQIEWCSFDGGYSYINYTDKNSDANIVYERFAIIDTDAKHIFISPTDSDYSIICGGDGVYMVKKKTKSDYTGSSEMKIGIIKSDGTWLVEPTDENHFYSDNMHNGLIGTEYVYRGEHIFSISRNDYEKESDYDREFNLWLDLYNADTDTYQEFEEMEMLSNFENGKAILYKTYNLSNFTVAGTSLYTIDSSNFSTKEIIEGLGWGGRSGQTLTLSNRPTASEGYIFGISYHDWESYNHFDTDSIEANAFFDFSGNKVIDLEQYNVLFYNGINENERQNFCEFHNGKAVIELSGNGDGSYIVTINTKGDFLYEPIKISRKGNYDYKKGIISAKANRNIDGDSYEADILIDATTGEVKEMDFDVVSDKWSEGYCYKDGYFIDSNGKVLKIKIK